MSPSGLPGSVVIRFHTAGYVSVSGHNNPALRETGAWTWLLDTPHFLPRWAEAPSFWFPSGPCFLFSHPSPCLSQQASPVMQSEQAAELPCWGSFIVDTILDGLSVARVRHLVGKGLSQVPPSSCGLLQGKSRQKLKRECKQKPWRNATYWLTW